MRVWVFNQFAGSPENSSGAGERYHFIAKKMKKKYDIDLTIFAASYNHLFIKQPLVSKSFTVEHIEGVRYCWVKIPRYSSESGLGRLFSWMIFMMRLFFIPKEVGSKPDRIIVSSMSMFPIYPALLQRAFSKKRIKVIFEIRDIWPLTLIEIGGFSKFNPIIAFLNFTEWIAYRSANHIVSVLPYADRHIKTKISKPFSFTWIPNGIDIVEFDIRNEANDKEFDQSAENKIIVAYAGAIGKANSLDSFIKSFENLQEPEKFIYLILGTGPDIDRLRKLSKENKSIIFKGKVPKRNVNPFLRKSDILFIGWHDLPIYRFGVSANKYSDYMLAKKPIISSGNLVYEPVREANCGLVVQTNNPIDIARAIELLMEMPIEERIRLGDNGYQYLNKNNSIDVLSEKFRNVLLGC